MNTMKWLVKREFWEHKGGFFWAPIVVGSIMVFFLAATVFSGVILGHSHGFEINGDSVSSISGAMTPQDQSNFANALATSYMATSAPLFIVLGVVVFFFSLGALFDDRKDRSVLFWKSLPVSDSATVLSKVAIALVVAPLITLVIATAVAILSMIVIFLGSVMIGLHGLGQMFANPGLYISPFQVAAMLPVYAFWALPTIGWLMMVSAWARTKPFLWAVGLPVFTGTLLSWFNAMFNFDWNIDWFWQYIVGRGLLSVLPGTWFAQHPMSGIGESMIQTGNGIHHHTEDMGSVMVQSWHVFATADLWIGVAAGAAMIYVAIRLRRWRDEG